MEKPNFQAQFFPRLPEPDPLPANGYLRCVGLPKTPIPAGCEWISANGLLVVATENAKIGINGLAIVSVRTVQAGYNIPERTAFFSCHALDGVETIATVAAPGMFGATP